MTRFDTDLASRGWALISEGAQMISLAYVANEQPAAGAGPSPARAPAPADDLPPLPSLEEPPGYQPKGVNLADQHVENTLAQCPNHQKPWVIKPAGVSKTGKEYAAFYKCPERDSSTRSGYCDKKPVKAWTDAHPIAA